MRFHANLDFAKYKPIKNETTIVAVSQTHRSVQTAGSSAPS